MKPALSILLAGVLSSCLYAQTPQTQHPEMKPDNKCDFKAEAGKPINFSMTIKGVDPAKYNQLYGRVTLLLSSPDEKTDVAFRQIVAYSLATKDTQDPNLFHFTGTVPVIIAGGVYRGTMLAAYYAQTGLTGSSSEADTKAQEEAHAYCLTIDKGTVPEKMVITGFDGKPNH